MSNLEVLFSRLAPTSEERNQPSAIGVQLTKGTVTSVSSGTATVQFAASTDVPTSPVAGIYYLTKPDVGDVVSVAVTGATRLILGTIGGTGDWQSYTPTVSASSPPNLGTGAVRVGNYLQFGELVIAKIVVKFGTGGAAGSGQYYITLPVAADTAPVGFDQQAIGQGRMIDSSSSNTGILFPEIETPTTMQLVYYSGIGGTAGASTVSNTTPWAWGAGDTIFNGTIVYMAA